MKRYIQTLKAKPEKERKQIALVGSVVCTALVGVIWVYTLGHKSEDRPVQAQSNSKPFALLGDALKGTYVNISASIGSAKSVSSKMKTSQETEPESEKIIPLIPVER